MKKSTRDETSCPLMKKDAKGHCPGVVSIVGMPLMLLFDDHGRLACDDTHYPLWENFINLLKTLFCLEFFLIFLIFKALSREAHLLLKSEGWRKKCKNAN